MHRSKNRGASIEGLREAPLVSRLLAGTALTLLAAVLLVPASSLAQSVTGTGGITPAFLRRHSPTGASEPI